MASEVYQLTPVFTRNVEGKSGQVSKEVLGQSHGGRVGDPVRGGERVGLGEGAGVAVKEELRVEEQQVAASQQRPEESADESQQTLGRVSPVSRHQHQSWLRRDVPAPATQPLPKDSVQGSPALLPVLRPAAEGLGEAAAGEGQDGEEAGERRHQECWSWSRGEGRSRVQGRSAINQISLP